MTEPWITMTAEDAMESVKSAMQQMLTDYVVPAKHTESYFYNWYVSANASGLCNLRPTGQRVCQSKAFAMLGGRPRRAQRVPAPGRADLLPV